ncbi:MAG: (2Fe-2S)-binding protein, partial [Bradyrhizobium sp.]|nr:(2Fe-2S)-binding protein [Bradyrhizobium sp.]
AGNDWRIDRLAQQKGTIYSGIDGIHLQDQAITESLGPIVDHELEHLAPSDQMITRTRRRLLMAARALRDQGVAPPGAEDGSVYRGARSGYFVSNEESDWQKLYANKLAEAVHPQQQPMHAAE